MNTTITRIIVGSLAFVTSIATMAQQDQPPVGARPIAARRGSWPELLLALLLLALLLPALPAADIEFPADTRIHDVKRDYGAKGDGIADDTEALQKALSEWQNKHMEIVYLPAGTYLVSKPLRFFCWMMVQGAGEARTTIKLKDGAPGYQDPAKPQSVLASVTDAQPCPCYSKNVGGCNMAFSQHINDLTIDSGKGNPGAVGIHFISNNGGGLFRVSIRSGDGAGVSGLDLWHPWNGPCFFQHVTITGFDQALRVRHATYASTFEHLSISGQRVCGILNDGHPLSIRGLKSRNRVPAIRNVSGDGHIALIDSVLEGGSKDAAAIEGEGGLFLRDVEVKDYALALKTGGKQSKELKAGTVEEYVSGQIMGPGTKSLRLPVKETPEQPWEAPSAWKSVMAFAPIELTDATRKPTDKLWGHPMSGFDISEALQKAIDSGATTVYLPHGSYLIRKSIHLRGKLKVLQGCGSILVGDKTALGDTPMFIADGTGSEPLFIDRISSTGNDGPGKMCVLEDASPRPLVVLKSRWMSYRNAAGCGELFVDDMCGAPWTFNVPQKAWFRSLNMESGEVMITNRAADIWILGIKTEGRGITIDSGKGSKNEILGGILYPAGGDPKQGPSFRNTDGQVSYSHAMFWANPLYIDDTIDGKQTKLEIGDGKRFMWLYSNRN